MKGRKLSWILTVFMLVNIFTGIQIMLPLGAYAAADASWQSNIYGSGATTSNCTISPTPDYGTVTISTSVNNAGKIANGGDGIAFYNKPLNSSTPFQISADVQFTRYGGGTNTQVASGLMLRNNDVGATNTTGAFIAVGAYGNFTQALSRRSESPSTVTSSAFSATAVATGVTYNLKLMKTDDNKCIVTCGTNSIAIDVTDIFNQGTYNVGLFVARDAAATFTNVDLTTVSSIRIKTLPTKTTYKVNESLDPAGMEVTATMGDGSEQDINANDCQIGTFDSSTIGVKDVKVYYAGRSTTLNVNVVGSLCTEINVLYTPAKTTYYIDDPFDTSGMVVNATFDSGLTRVLDPTEYTLSGFDSSTAGSGLVTVTYNEDPSIKASFPITVLSSNLTGLEITKPPKKTIYYIGETLDLSGLVVSAVYDDSKKVMLQSSEYTTSPAALDTSTAGDKTIEIKHKGKAINLPLKVKSTTLTGAVVTKYPKTTFYIGESFDSTGIEVSKVYDSGETVALNSGEYTINSSAFDGNTAGTYHITVTPDGISPITYDVTVRPQTTYTWDTAIFGQSVNKTTNFVTPSAIGSITGVTTITALTGGGKITAGHDGISYYYTTIDPRTDNFVLSADIKVIEFAKSPPDAQEAFGIMARDAVGTYATGTQPAFSSNMVAVGGRGTSSNNPSKTEFFMRSGVTTTESAVGSTMTQYGWNTTQPMPGETYRLTLAKTNTGFTGSMQIGSTSNSALFYMPDNFSYLNPDKMYIGFFTARLATIEVSNVSLAVSNAATDAPRVMPPEAAVTPSANVISLTTASKTAYALKYKPNVNGTIIVKQDETVIDNDVVVTANQEYVRNTTITPGGKTNFTITFTPDPAQNLTSYDRIITHHTVTMKTYNTTDGAIYVSPTGKSTAAGNSDDPLDLDTAINFVKEGQTIYMLGGTYNRTAPVLIPVGNNGGSGAAMKTLSATNSAIVTLDFGSVANGLQVSGDYWHIYGIGTTKATKNGVKVTGSHNIIEMCKIYANGDTGLQLSATGDKEPRSTWPTYNLIKNCEAYDNKDASENNADGFAAKLTCGEGNRFEGCISHNNIDDGWDLYTKSEIGTIGAITIENCIAYNNGSLTNGYVGSGDKNGFKLGGEGIGVTHVVNNCIAFGNGKAGFTTNSNPNGTITNCVAYNNTDGNFVYTTYNTNTPVYTMTNCISLKSSSGTGDSYPSANASTSNYFWNGSASKNSSGAVLPAGYFKSTTAVVPYLRDANGNIIYGNFLQYAGPTYTASASPNSCTYAAVTVGYSPIAAQQFIISNTGTMPLTNVSATLASGLKFTISSALSSSTIAVSTAATVSVKPNNSLAAGTYTDTLRIRGDNGLTLDIPLSFTVDPSGLTYTASAAPSSCTFAAVTEGYSPVMAQQFTISNTGTGALTNVTATLASGSKFTTSAALSSNTIAVSGTATVSIKPNNSLVAGTYTDTLQISGDNGLILNIPLSFTVNAAGPIYTASGSPNPCTFPTATVGYVPFAAQKITITNTGNQVLTNVNATLANGGSSKFTIFTSLTPSAINVSSTAAISVKPNDALVAGTYTDTLQIRGDNGLTLNIPLSFTVIPSSASQAVFDVWDFGAGRPADSSTVRYNNYFTVDWMNSYIGNAGASKTIGVSTITAGALTVYVNSGSDRLRTTTDGVNCYDSNVGNVGLIDGFTATGRVYFNGSPTVSGNVPSARYYRLNLNTNDTVIFYGGTDAAGTINFANSSGTIINTYPTAGATEEKFTFAVPAAGTYNIFTPGGKLSTYRIVRMPATYTASGSPNPCTFTTVTAGYSPVAAKQVTISNTGTMALSNVNATLASGSVFTISTALSSNTIAVSGTATVSIKPNNSLAAGSYTDMLQIRGDNGLSLDIPLSFTVNAAVTPAPDPTPTPTPDPTPTPAPAPAPTPAPAPAPAPVPLPTVTLPAPTVDNRGNATVTIAAQTIQGLVEKAQADASGVKKVGVVVPEVIGATSYNSVLPASSLNASALTQRVEVRTAIGNVDIPGNMLSNAGIGASNVSISIAAVNKSTLPAEIQSQIGNRPVIDLSVSSNGNNVSFNNPDAPVKVSIPYKPTASELKDPEHIVVWYIDGQGNAVPMTDAKYDAATGMVVFTTTHFSKYVVTAVYKTFDDLKGFGWVKDPAEVLASKGIINGITDKAFAPAKNISRADFTVWLVKTLNLTASFSTSFSDVKTTDGYYNEVGIAKKLGIVNGDGKGKFSPAAAISRQEMFVMTARALKLVKKLSASGTAADLNSFKDKASVASFAVNDIASLIKDGIITGSAGILNPKGNGTRAEAASLLYKVFNKK